MVQARILAALLALVALVALAGCAPKERAAKEFTVVRENEVDDRLTAYTLRTPLLDDTTYARVLLPEGYEDSERRYPVIYVLHGLGSNFTWATEFTDIEELTEDLPAIVVMPDGGVDGWYSNWRNDGDLGRPEWENFHIEELIPWVDEEFRTVADKSGRAILGASMGGFGALSYAARHPDLFEAAASLSGLMNTGDPWALNLIDAALEKTGHDEGDLWGERDEHLARWQAHNPLDLAEKLRGTEVLLYTGNGRPGGPLGGGPDLAEASLHRTNLELAARLDQLGIPYELHDFGPGAHTLPYLSYELDRALPELAKLLGASPAPAPG